MAIFSSEVFLAMALGLFSWGFLEYNIHRFAGHKWKNNPFGKSHTEHHSNPSFFVPFISKVITAFVVGFPIFLFAWAIAGLSLALVYSSFLIGAYLFYENVHQSLHYKAPKTKLGFYLRKHHFYHHYHNKNHNHGVTSTLWDWAYGTLTVPEKVRIPRVYAETWMVDPVSDDLKKEYQEHFYFSGKQPKKKVKAKISEEKKFILLENNGISSESL